MKPSRSRVPPAVCLVIALLLALSAPAAASHTKNLGHWTMDEGSGQTVGDASGENNHGVLGATPAVEPTDPMWRSAFSLSGRGTWLQFDGDDYVTVAESPSLEAGDVTVEAWIRATGSPGSYRYIASKGAVRCERASYGLYANVDGALTFYVSNGEEAVFSPSAGPSVWDGNWHHVAGTFGSWDQNRVRLYVDGKQVGNGTVSTVKLRFGLPEHNRFHIGNYLGTCPESLGFVGDIDGVRLWNVAMTSGDISFLSKL